MRRVATITSFVLVIGSVAWGVTSSLASPPAGIPSVAGPDYGNPIAGGIEVLNPVDPRLPFVPDIPDRLGPPVRIQITHPGDVPIEMMEVAWAFSSPVYGDFLIFQHAADSGPTEIEYRQLSEQVAGCVTRDATLQEIGELGAGGPRTECSFGIDAMVALPGALAAMTTKARTRRWYGGSSHSSPWILSC